MTQITNLTLDPENSGTATCTTQTNINNALFSNNSGATEPTLLVDGMFWYDNVNKVHKLYTDGSWSSLYDIKTNFKIGQNTDAVNRSLILNSAPGY